MHLFKLAPIRNSLGVGLSSARDGRRDHVPSGVLPGRPRHLADHLRALYLLPLMAGLLLVSIASGQIISRTGQVPVLPIAGSGSEPWACSCLQPDGGHT